MLDLTNLSQLKQFLHDSHLWLNKKLGQNFLIDREVLADIVKTSQLSKDDTVVEIGPGVGTLTQELCKNAGEVLAIEKDRGLAAILAKSCKDDNLKILVDNALFAIAKIHFKRYKVVANLPYNISSPTLRFFLEKPNKPQMLVLLLQKEVAQRLTAKPGDSNRGILTVMLEFYARAEIIRSVPSTAFFPIPKVDSAIIKIDTNVKRPQNINEEIFFRLVKLSFQQKRRQIHNSLSSGLRLDAGKTGEILAKAGISPVLRSEDLTLDDWLRLYENLPKG